MLLTFLYIKNTVFCDENRVNVLLYELFVYDNSLHEYEH